MNLSYNYESGFMHLDKIIATEMKLDTPNSSMQKKLWVSEIEIDKAEDNYFKLIFRMIRSLVNHKVNKYGNSEAIIEFKENEKELARYFTTLGNDGKFVNSIAKMSEKNKIRDYYLAPLHQIDEEKECYLIIF